MSNASLIKSKIELALAQSKLLEEEIKNLQEQLWNEEKTLISWNELEELAINYEKANRPFPHNSMEPHSLLVYSKQWHRKDYAYIRHAEFTDNEKACLVIGGYYHRDGFPRGEELWIKKETLELLKGANQ